ncbi:MAG TPA: phytase [Pseudoxanthomonas sp.]|nr:phytase [Pseudoxanthomonas sp.]
MKIQFLIGSMLLASLCACTSHRPRANPPPDAPAPVVAADVVIPEAWVTAQHPDEELDSLAVWPTPDGGAWVLATGKASHTLAVYDAETGARLRTVGGPGEGAGEFRRPNGIAVFGDLVFVVERDNRRVQVLGLPEFRPLGMVGEGRLQVPYGLWVHETAPDVLELLVTDSFMADARNGELPPMERLDQRVKRFEVTLKPDGGIASRYLAAFGDTGEQGALRMVESIAGDAAHDRLLIADEDRRVGSTLRDYTLEGRYRGHSLPAFEADAEGIALWDCDASQGYWVAVDQLRPTVFRVFDRRSLRPLKTFSGRTTANTDGQALFAGGMPRFPAGALYALHDDRSIAAFDLRDLVRALGLSKRCVQ